MFLLESLGENLFPCLFQCLEAAYRPWLMAASLTSASITSPSLTLTLLPSSPKDEERKKVYTPRFPIFCGRHILS